MPNNDASNHSPSQSGDNSDDKRPENISKNNILLPVQNTNTVQQDKIRKTRPVHPGKTHSENEQKTGTEALMKSKERKDLRVEDYITISRNKTKKISCSCASCMLESEQLENTLKGLQSQIQELSIELSNYKNDNQLLRKDINRAKSVIKRDIGRNVESFEDIVKKMTEDSWSGQQEKIVSLKKELRALKEELKEKGLKPPSPVKRREFMSPEKISNDRKVHWRLTLERQSIFRQTKREKNDLIEDRDRMKGKLELKLNRNKDLEEQVESIRQELKETGKGSNGNFISRLHDIEKNAKFCLDEKTRLRRSVEEEETKEKQLLYKIEDLKAELFSQKKAFEITKESLSKMNSDETAILTSVAAFESEALSGLRDIDENLTKVDEGHMKNEKRLNILIDLIFAFEELFSQQRPISPLSNRSDNQLSSITSISADTPTKESSEQVESERTESTNERVESERTDSINERIPTVTTLKEIMQVYRESFLVDAEKAMQDTKEKLEGILTHKNQHCPKVESTSLKDDYDRIVTLSKDKEENLRKSDHIYDLLDKFKKETEEMLKKTSQCWRTAWQLKTMSLKNKRLQKLLKNYAKALVSQQYGYCHITWDELINKGEAVCNIFEKENKFLRRLITNVAQSKAYDFDLYTFECKKLQHQIKAQQQASIVC